MPFLKSLVEVLRNLKRDGVRPKICPKCGSQRVSFLSKYDLWLFPEQYVCKDCGYQGSLFIELEKDEKKGKKEAEGRR